MFDKYNSSPPTSTSRPPDVNHMISVPNPFIALPLLCIILNANWRAKMGEAWEQGYSKWSSFAVVCTKGLRTRQALHWFYLWGSCGCWIILKQVTQFSTLHWLEVIWYAQIKFRCQSSGSVHKPVWLDTIPLGYASMVACELSQRHHEVIPCWSAWDDPGVGWYPLCGCWRWAPTE